MAPDAKLAFTDLGSNGQGGIYTPQVVFILKF